MRGRALVAAISLAVLGMVMPGRAQTPAPAAIAPLLDALAHSAEQPESYKAQFSVRVKMRVFPFWRMTLHGQSEYVKPGLYHFVIRDAPMLAKPWSDVHYDLGDPSQWPQRYEIAFAPGSTDAAPVLRMAPRAPKLVRYVDVALDPTDHERIAKMTWTRGDGGVISLAQRFVPVAGRQLIARQEASIDLPVFKASVEANYDAFADTH